MFWSFIQQAGTQALTLAIFSILARLLGPSEYGIIGMCAAWLAFISVFSEMGFGSALIQRQNVTSHHFSSVFFVNVAAGIALFLIGLLLSVPAAAFFKSQDVKPVMAVLSTGFIFEAFSFSQRALARREMRFRDLAIRDIVATLIGGVVGIALAYRRFGVWSLVAQSLITSLLGAILFWRISQWRPRFQEFSVPCLKELWPYSAKLSLYNVFKYFAQNSDKLIIGHWLGSVALGYYTFASRVVLTPVNVIVLSLGNYWFPKCSRMQGKPQQLGESYLFVNKVTVSILGPLIVVGAMLSPALVHVLFGNKWIPAVRLIQILAVVGFAQSLISPVGVLMKALDRPDWLLYWSVFMTFLSAILMGLGVTLGGITFTVWGLAVAHLIGLWVVFVIATRLVGLRIRDLVLALLPACSATGILWLLLWKAKGVESQVGLLCMPLAVVSGLVFYIGYLFWLDRPFLQKIMRRMPVQT